MCTGREIEGEKDLPGKEKQGETRGNKARWGRGSEVMSRKKEEIKGQIVRKGYEAQEKKER